MMLLDERKQKGKGSHHLMVLIALIFLILFSQSAIAQKDIKGTDLVGRWKLKTIKNGNSQEVDIALSENSKKIIFNRFLLKKNSFKGKSWGQKLTGNWQVQDGHVQLTFNNNHKVAYNIIKSTRKQLVLQPLEFPYNDLTLIYMR